MNNETEVAVTDDVLDEMLDGVENAPANQRLPFIKADTGGSEYILELKAEKPKRGFGGDDFAIFEFTVLSAEGTVINKVGTQVAAMPKLSGKYKASGLGNLRAIIGALRDVDPDSLTRAQLAGALKNHEDVGKQVRCSAKHDPEVETQSGDPFVRLTWTPAV